MIPLQLREHIATVDQQAAGALQFTVVEPKDFGPLERDAANGCAESNRLLCAASDLARRIEHEAGGRECAACPAALQWPCTVVIAGPYRSDATVGIGVGVCPSCGPTREAAITAAESALRMVWPGLRHIEISPGVGRA